MAGTHETEASRSRLRRHAAGLAAAVLGTSLAAALAAAAFILAVDPPAPRPVGLVLGVFAATAVVATAAALLIGLPLTWILAVNRLENDLVYPLAGFAAGAGIPFLAILALLPPREVAAATPVVAAAGLAGALSGFLWWHFGRRHLQGGE